LLTIYNANSTPSASPFGLFVPMINVTEVTSTSNSCSFYYPCDQGDDQFQAPQSQVNKNYYLSGYSTTIPLETSMSNRTEGNYHLSVYNTTGIECINETCPRKGITVFASQLPGNGLYTYRIIDENGKIVQTGKIVK